MILLCHKVKVFRFFFWYDREEVKTLELREQKIKMKKAIRGVSTRYITTAGPFSKMVWTFMLHKCNQVKVQVTLLICDTDYIYFLIYIQIAEIYFILCTTGMLVYKGNDADLKLGCSCEANIKPIN